MASHGIDHFLLESLEGFVQAHAGALALNRQPMFIEIEIGIGIHGDRVGAGARSWPAPTRSPKY